MIRTFALGALLLNFVSCQPVKMNSPSPSTSTVQKKNTSKSNGTKDGSLSKSIFTDEQSQKIDQTTIDNQNNTKADVDPMSLVAPEDLSTNHVCAGGIADRWTTIKGATNGLSVRLYPPSRTNKDDDADGIEMRLSAEDSIALRDEIMAERHLKLSFANIPDGTYELVICARGSQGHCTRPNLHYYGGATPQNCSYGYLSGQLGTIVDDSNVESGCKYMSVWDKATAGGINAANIGFSKPELITVKDHQLRSKPEVVVYYDNPITYDPGTTNVSVATRLQYDPANGCNSLISPLLVDLDGSGISLASPLPGVRFDVDANGRKEQISWPKAGRGSFLVLDRDNDSAIEDGSELFGDHSASINGRHFLNGFDALTQYDDNHDGVIDANDSVFTRLRLWSDINENAQTDPGELKSLDEVGVVSIDLHYQAMSEEDRYGNATRQRSAVHLKSGEVRVIFDVWFRPI